MMKAAFGALGLSLLTFACAASTTAEEAESQEANVAVADPAPVAKPDDTRAKAPVRNDEDVNGTLTGGGLPPEMVLALGEGSRWVTSYVFADDGAVIGTGVFAGQIDLGRTRLTSRGQDDVFMVKVTKDARLAWAVAVGSKRLESSPRVKIEDGRVKLVGMTNGGPDCGGGSLPTWSSETFFFCTFEPHDGALIAGGTFPTGSP